MTKRAYNFNAGPAALPLEVLEQAKEQLTDYKGIGMSVMEISHRSKEYEEINQTAQDLFAELLNLPAGYKVLFLQGGASSQFAMKIGRASCRERGWLRGVDGAVKEKGVVRGRA